MSTNWNIIEPKSMKTGYMKGQPCQENCVAYCHHRRHKGALSKDMLKQHECLKKQCRYLEKCYEHPYWSKKQYINDQKKAGRARNVQGTSKKNRTGSNVNIRSSSLNTDMKLLLEGFNNMEVFHTYIFYKDDTSRIRYLGGFYEQDAAKSKARQVSDKEGGDYVVIADEEDTLVGFRLEPTIRSLIEIDLTWSAEYTSFHDRVFSDMSVKKAANII